MKKKFLLALTAPLLAATCQLQAQTLTNLIHQAPDGAEVEMLLTDGTVLVQGYQDQDWYKLTPDINGSYINGTWTQVASLASNYDPYAMAEAVLADGRVLIEGGEYNFGSFSFTNLGAVYDPVANTWTPLTPPPGWDYIGDSPCAVLPNGNFIIGRKFDMQMAELDPHTMTWTALGSSGKSDWHAEEGWTLMPDGTLLTVDVLNNPNSERYIPSEQRWVSDGNTVANLQGPPEVGCIPYGGGTYCPPGETGNAVLRPDGTVFATGAIHQGARAGHTAIYRPGASPTDPGTWTAGPDFPNGDSADDNFAVLLTNGKVLVEGSNTGRFYEWDGTNFTDDAQQLRRQSDHSSQRPGTGGWIASVSSGRRSPAGLGADRHHRPDVRNAWSDLSRHRPPVQRLVAGRVVRRRVSDSDQLSPGAHYQLATGHIFYARTHDHSYMGVVSRNTPTYTNFDVPAGMETGPSKLVVVANGIASNPTTITVN